MGRKESVGERERESSGERRDMREGMRQRIVER